MTRAVGLITGSAHARLGLEIVSRSPTKTPYGPPSSPILEVAFHPHRVACIARHGEGSTIPPHAINYRANLWALHQHGVRRCVGVSAVGTLDPGFPPGELAVPEQLLDYTWGRAHTFCDGDGGEVVHVDFTAPFDPGLRGRVAAAAEAAGCSIRGGVYGATQGPRLETAAEIDRLQRDGCTMVGMTGMPEAALARELGMAYAICATAVNHAAGRGEEPDIHRQLERYLGTGVERLAATLQHLIPDLCASP